MRTPTRQPDSKSRKKSRRRYRRYKRLAAKYLPLLLVICLVIGLFFSCRREEPVQTEPVETAQPSAAPTIPDTRNWAERTVDAFCDYSGTDRSAYPQSMIELLEKNPETRTFVLEYPVEKDKSHAVDMSEFANSDTVPLFLQWDKRWGYMQYGNDVAGITACGPVCLSMVAYYLTGDPDMSPDKMIEFAIQKRYCIPGNGTSWTLISKGAKDLGLNVRELALVEAYIRREVQAGNPVICVMGPGVFTTTGHYIILTGYENGMYRINDPNSVEKSNKLWRFEEFQDQIRNLWAISK